MEIIESYSVIIDLESYDRGENLTERHIWPHNHLSLFTGISPNLPNIYPVTFHSHRLHSFVKSVIVLNAIFETDSNPFRLRISPIILLRTSSTGFFCMARWNQDSGRSKNGPFQEQRSVC